MARPLRIEYPDAVYHVTSRGNDRQNIFKKSLDREHFLNTLHSVNDRYNWICHAYCLMDNHYHLLIETPDGNLSFGMRQINGVYTQSFNKRYRKSGHVFQGRYKAVLIQKDSHLLEVGRYIVLNPVRAGVAEKPEGWAWSSYCATAGYEMPPPCLTVDWILSQFGMKKKAAITKYRQFVRDGINRESIWKNLKGQSLIGEDDFVVEFAEYLKDKEKIREIPKSQRLMNRPPIEVLLTPEIIRDRKKRNEKIKEAVDTYGYKQNEVADYLGLHYTSISRLLGQAKMLKVKT